jgi:hypothetical protein
MHSQLPLMTARFIVTGMSFDPHECTRHFGVEPTKVRTKGEPGIKKPVPQSSWSVDTKWERFDSTDAPLQLVLGKIWPKRKQIRDFVLKNKLKVEFLLNINGAGERNFVYEFSLRTISRMNYFHAPFSLDVY